MVLEDEFFNLGNSLISGRGVFSKAFFKKNNKLFEIKGKFFELKNEKSVSKDFKNNLIRFSKQMYINPSGQFANFLNHSCNPNSYIQKINNKLFLFSLKSIFKNQEITLDYSTILAKDDNWKMICNCKNKNCRKLIQKYSLLPLSLLKKYLKLNLIPQYILKI